MDHDPYTRDATATRNPPRGVRATLRELGPGMILVGSVVGSGELIMTTKLGAVAGFTLLWFVILACVIKVVVQAELARHTISSGQTFLQVFNCLPGPSWVCPRWLGLPWMATVVTSSVCGLFVYVHWTPPVDATSTAPPSIWFPLGIATAVIAVWVIAAGIWNRFPAAEKHAPEVSRPRINWFMCLWLLSMLLLFVNSGAILGGAGQAVQLAFPNVFGAGGATLWAVCTAVVTAMLLFSGTYAFLEKTLLALVCTFTLLTLICTILLQWTGYAVTSEQLLSGLTLEIPSAMTRNVLLTAMAMYAATGVAYGEMWTYSYWCVEKGYARNVGTQQPGEDWGRRARGWVRVMYTDVLLTMVVYTLSTVCFYLLGAAVLYKMGLDPDGQRTLAVLETMYTGSLGSWVATLFVVGAFFVLFTTVVAGVAGFSRLMADALGVLGIIDPRDYPARKRMIRVFVVVSLVLFSIAYWVFQNPPKMLLVTSSICAALMYPAVGLGAIYLRYHGVDSRLTPGRWTTAWLWICGITLAVISPAGIVLAILL
ncbi:MAG: Nramp family divalent metal transporter [Planctomycetaceae bacterium]